MSENLFELYSQKILALATEIPLTAPIENANGHAKKRSPICGSEVEISLELKDGRVASFSQEVNACALGQASSAIFARQIIGRSPQEIANLYDELVLFLKNEGAAPSAPFEDYRYLEPAQKHKNRHASILLPAQSTLAALNDAQSKHLAK